MDVNPKNMPSSYFRRFETAVMQLAVRLQTVFLHTSVKRCAAETQLAGRIGRSGRHDGNSTNVTIASARPHDLYYFMEPRKMIAGEVTTPVTAEQTAAEYGDWIDQKLGSRELTIFFPVVSPDESKVFFKPCIPGGGDSYKGMSVSKRDGKAIYDLANRKFIRLVEQWGHPSWTPDSTGIFEKSNFVLEVESGKTLPRYAPSCFSDHPTVSPDGSVFVTDADVTKRPFGKPGHWAIGIGSTTKDEFVIVDLFDNTKGATSWRHNHPHPAFSADGKRVYYNVNDGPWTRLTVAERK